MSNFSREHKKLNFSVRLRGPSGAQRGSLESLEGLNGFCFS